MDVAAKPALKEVRIGLVLYGGVSLAVYMNGITTELWHLLRASRARGKEERERLGGTSAAVYRRMLDELATVEELRVVVDAIAGSSAGGVNGAALAKAIADGADASVLGEVWIKDADIAALRVEPPKSPWWVRALAWTACRFERVGALRDKVDKLPGLSWAWLRDTAYCLATTRDGHATPLDGRYFTRMIGTTFRRMVERGDGVPLMPNRGTLDLFLTRTDFHGWPRHLPVSEEFHGTALYETTHAHVMAFRSVPRFPADGGTVAARPRLADDFELTFACRSTAGFPGAFAPLRPDDAATDFISARPDSGKPDLRVFATRHLREHSLFKRPAETAWMIDGGVLDNRPFTDVARAIERKPADHEVYRVVAFVEPDPDLHVMQEPGKGIPLPPQVLKGLFGLFRHEPIYDDLRSLGDRNAKVERIRAIRDANRPGAEILAQRLGRSKGLAWPPQPADLPQWDVLVSGGRTDAPDIDFPGYMALRSRCAADTLAAVICTALAFPYPSRHAYFIRSLVRAWLDREGALRPPAPVAAEAQESDGRDAAMSFIVAEPQAALLAALDVAFAVRRLRSLVQAVNGGYADLPPDGAAREQERRELDDAKSALAEIAFGYEALLHDTDAVKAGIDAAVGDKVGNIDDLIDALRFDATSAVERFAPELRGIYATLVDIFTGSCRRLSARVARVIAALPGTVRDAAAIDYVTFPLVDRQLLPLMDAAGIGDLITVRTMRISPQDSSRLAKHRPPLMGRELGAFKGFLDRRAREHDLLWGRLDAIERVIQLVFTAVSADPAIRARLEPRRHAFAAEAMRAAMAEEVARPDTTIADIAARIEDALAQPPDA